MRIDEFLASALIGGAWFYLKYDHGIYYPTLTHWYFSNYGDCDWSADLPDPS